MCCSALRSLAVNSYRLCIFLLNNNFSDFRFHDTYSSFRVLGLHDCLSSAIFTLMCCPALHSLAINSHRFAFLLLYNNFLNLCFHRTALLCIQFYIFIIIITTKNVNTKYCVCFNGKIYILWWYCRFRTIYRGGSNAPNYMLCFWSNLVAYVVFSFFCNFFRRQVATGWLPHHNYRKLL